MERDEFERELARYPRVRGADYRAGWVVEVQTRADEQPRAGQGAAEAKAGGEVKTRFEGDFWAALSEFLLQRYDEGTAKLIVADFRKGYNEAIAAISLDDLEALAQRL